MTTGSVTIETELFASDTTLSYLEVLLQNSQFIDLDLTYILEKYSVLAYLTHVMIKLKTFHMFFRSEHVRNGDV